MLVSNIINFVHNILNLSIQSLILSYCVKTVRIIKWQMKNIDMANNDIKILFFMPLVLPHGQPGVSYQTEFESENFAVFLALKIYHQDLIWDKEENEQIQATFSQIEQKYLPKKKDQKFRLLNQKNSTPQKYCFVLQFQNMKNSKKNEVRITLETKIIIYPFQYINFHQGINFMVNNHRQATSFALLIIKIRNFFQ